MERFFYESKLSPMNGDKLAPGFPSCNKIKYRVFVTDDGKEIGISFSSYARGTRVTSLKGYENFKEVNNK